MQKIKSTVFLSEDPLLKEIPILSADQKKITVNSVLYRVSCRTPSKYDKAKFEIEALRVFHVNNTTRTFRVRCIKGCEEVFKIADGCSTTKLYSSLESAKKQVWKSFEEYRKEWVSGRKKADKQISEVISARRTGLTKKVQLPRAV